MARGWAAALARWVEAGLIGGDTAARIRAFEQEHARSAGLHWAVPLAIAFGALMTGAGVLLFVAANWDSLSPAWRVTLVLALVAVFHLAGAAVAERFPALSSAMHAVGTIALGAGIFLAGQIFNLEEHWPGGLMLWALGAAIAWGLLGHWPQMALLALLVPGWLAGEWIVAVEGVASSSSSAGLAAGRVAAAGAFLLALAYFTAARGGRREHLGTLHWLGGVLFVPASIALAVTSSQAPASPAAGPATLPPGLLAIGWTVALGLPALVAVVTRRRVAWPNLLAAAWVVALIQLRSIGTLPLYAWWATGALALVSWGVAESRTERVNLGSAMFACTILAFYFSEVMDKLGRSASLIGVGILFIAGGWALERGRRHLIRRMEGGRP